jgi:LmbE family N-acetylglucosaminyl deacetylase
MILAEGITSRAEERNRGAFTSELSSLAEAAERSRKVLGIESMTLHGLPDNRMDQVDRLDVIKLVEDGLLRIRPDVVYTHHGGDLNVDHRRCNEAVMTACRPAPKSTVQTLLFFEIPSSTEWTAPGSFVSFQPDWFVDVTTTFARKMQALECYESEMRPWPNARSLPAIEALAAWRGATVGVHRAEAFVLGRRIVHETD